MNNLTIGCLISCIVYSCWVILYRPSFTMLFDYFYPVRLAVPTGFFKKIRSLFLKQYSKTLILQQAT